MQYIPGFWCNNILLTRDFKNMKTYQSIRGQQVVSLPFSYLEKLTRIDS